MHAVLEAQVREVDTIDANAQEVMDGLFCLLAEAEDAIHAGDKWLTPEEVDVSIEV